jgi:signal transduction histidine kinase
MFQVGREAIANMLRHAHATKMEVRLRYDSSVAVMTIRDNGVGFNATEGHFGRGIRGMQMRCTKVGAKMEIVSAANAGTTVKVSVPYGSRPKMMEWIRAFRKHAPDPFA